MSSGRTSSSRPGTGAGTQNETYSAIPAGTSCTVTETDNGGSAAVDVTVDGSPQTVDISAAGSSTVNITDTYEVADGSLTVTKTIAGGSAGTQGRVEIEVLCGGTLLEPFVIPAGTPAGDESFTYSGIPGGTRCIVAETVDGRTETVSVTVENRLDVVRVPAGGTGTVEITDTYEDALGALVVRKTIRGPAASERGPITIAVDCGDDVDTPDIVIPPANTAGTQQYGFYTGIPAGTVCTVTETENGATATAVVTVTGSPQEVTIPARRVAVASLTDTYDYAPGSLIVRKTIAGPKAGEQGEIVIRPVCDGVALDTVHHSGEQPRRHTDPHLRRPARRRELHRNRDTQRLHRHRLRDHRRRTAAGDRPTGRLGDRQRHRHLPGRGRLRHGGEDDRRPGGRPTGTHRDQDPMRRSDPPRLRHPRRRRCRHPEPHLSRPHPGRVMHRPRTGRRRHRQHHRPRRRRWAGTDRTRDRHPHSPPSGHRHRN